MMRWSIVLVSALVACAGDDPTAGLDPKPEDYLVPAGTYFEFTPRDTPGEIRMMRAVDGRHWVMRAGENWDLGEDLETFFIATDNGFWMGSDQLLPAEIEIGSEGVGVSVVDVDEWPTVYGTFQRAAIVERTDGRFAGSAALVPGVGPVTFSLDGVAWDIIYYEYPFDTEADFAVEAR